MRFPAAAAAAAAGLALAGAADADAAGFQTRTATLTVVLSASWGGDGACREARGPERCGYRPKEGATFSVLRDGRTVLKTNAPASGTIVRTLPLAAYTFLCDMTVHGRRYHFEGSFDQASVDRFRRRHVTRARLSQWFSVDVPSAPHKAQPGSHPSR